MTSANIAQVLAPRMETTPSRPVVNQSEKESFASFMDAASVKSSQTDVKKSETMDTTKADRNVEDSPEDETSTDTVKDTKAASKEEKSDAVENKDAETETKEVVASDSETEEEEADEAVKGAVMGVLAELAQVLEISVEELQETMSELDMEVGDLFTKEGFTKLFMTLKGETDQSFLLTGGELQGQWEAAFQVVTEGMAEIQESFSLSEEQMKQLLEKMSEIQEVPEEVITDAELSDGVDMMPELDESYQVTMTKDGKQVSYTMEQDGESGVVTTEGTTEVILGDEVRSQSYGDSDSSRQEHQFERNESMPGQAQAVVQNRNEVQQTIVNAFTEQLQSYSDVDTQSIMDQMMDYMKLEQTADLSKVEMQLNPANLGKLTIEIASKEGVMTAQITAQNEAVKNALEAQITVLKENFEEQGLKVESVEVMVETHSFEQSYQGQEEAEERFAGENKRRTHRIHLGELDAEDAEELTDEERMVAELMADRGQTVDYTV